MNTSLSLATPRDADETARTVTDAINRTTHAAAGA
jgi:hypothetical protein